MKRFNSIDYWPNKKNMFFNRVFATFFFASPEVSLLGFLNSWSPYLKGTKIITPKTSSARPRVTLSNPHPGIRISYYISVQHGDN